MTRTARLSPTRAAIDLIKRFEGCVLDAEPLGGGRWIIGYGHTRSARPGAKVSEADAEALLIYDLGAIAERLSGLVLVDLGGNQFDALFSFAYSIGADAFAGSDVLELINAGQPFAAATALEAWRTGRVGGRRTSLDLLARRRAAEKALFLKPDEGWKPAQSARLEPGREPDWPMLAYALEVTAPGAVSPVATAGGATRNAAERVTRRLGALLSEGSPPEERLSGVADAPAPSAAPEPETEIAPFPADPAAEARPGSAPAGLAPRSAATAGDAAFRRRIYGEPQAAVAGAPAPNHGRAGSPSPWAWLVAGSAVFLAGAGTAFRLRAEDLGATPEHALALALGAIGAVVAAGAAYRLIDRTAGRSR